MRMKINAAATVAICLLGLAQSALAQGDPNNFRPFGGFFAGMFADDSTSQPPPRRPAAQRQPKSRRAELLHGRRAAEAGAGGFD